MKLFVGLGNPGAKYARNRHNIGFMAVEAIAGEHGFGPWRAKFQGRLAEGRLGTEKVLLLEPQTYMNESGRSVGEAVRFYKFGAEDVVVFHDELDLAPGKVRAKRGGGHAGHNGLRSIHAQIGEAYARVRLGIGHPGDKSKVSGYVLNDFAAADRDWLDPLLERVATAAPRLAEDDLSGFMNAVAPSAPPRAPHAGERGPPSAPEAAEPEVPKSPFAKLSELFAKK
jgi:PTH1 family peptidyl-tRNA hydrolase